MQEYLDLLLHFCLGRQSVNISFGLGSVDFGHPLTLLLHGQTGVPVLQM